MDNEQLVKSIRQLCKNRNIAISQLENDLNFGAGLISRWSKNSPSIDKIVDIANYFHVSIDEVVGYNNIVNDKFLEKLISQTIDNTLTWFSYNGDDNNHQKYNPPLRSILECLDSESGETYRKTHQDVSYYTIINNGYISIYGYYEHQDILHPKEIKLFIQSDSNAQFMEQIYSYDQLKVLWLKVLYTLGDNAPDEIKAEEFKNDFINTPENLTNEKMEEFLNNPSLMKLMETVSTDEFQKIRKTFEDPQFKSAMQTLNSIQSYFNKGK